MTPLPERLFALLDLLQSHRRLTAGDLAVRLGVDERTVRRDIARLQALDIPVEVARGRGGGLQLPPGTLLPALRFTDDEALALALGLTLVSHVPGLALEHAAERALRRLEQVLSDGIRARVHTFGDALVFGEVARAAGATDSTPLASALVLDLAEAITHHRQVEIRYRAAGKGDSVRKLDPYALVQLIGRWYLVGYCHMRTGVRTFRLDRLQTLKVLGEGFAPPEGFDALAFVSDSIAKMPFPGQVACRALLHTSLDEARRLTPLASAVLEPHPAGVHLSFLVPPSELEAVALHLLRLPCEVSEVEPLELRHALEAVATRAMRLAGRSKVR